jgi:hypothetical protein
MSTLLWDAIEVFQEHCDVLSRSPVTEDLLGVLLA